MSRVLRTDPLSSLEELLVLEKTEFLTDVLFKLCLEETEAMVHGQW